MNELERCLPKRWTEKEDQTLYEEARCQMSTGEIKDGNRIGAKLPGRINEDCRKRWINKVCGLLKKGAWEPDEDQRLHDAICIHGQKYMAERVTK
ncbi:uncharacterized protein BO97DRAFT_424827 [Aspergillus homomorphus CBS 101889]|uniref:Myb-like domain-containing protein n=1 Tax=Aspergillus homomorphus (strain CBS 101889) TaxID=1450537 RepID=A0A395HXQ3_ASPHC|nr:hypothetical protein BO97DRAFT_424827 [Aspergillus homomorphus CBS 101889]RAL12306.1 hypothetical protein BO97DRAFT_424827 [Aspergillus homomorphus CBS 101889]